MPTLTLIRHAPTASNEQGIFMGTLDLPVGEQGLVAARTAGLVLASTKFTRYYSSPLLRARQTAECLFKNVPITFDERLIERGLGKWQNQSKGQVRKDYPEAFFSSGTMNPFFKPPDGEALEDVLSRVQSFLRNILSLDENDNVVVVTHNGILRVIRCWLEVKPLEEIFTASEPYLEPRSYCLNRLTCQI